MHDRWTFTSSRTVIAAGLIATTAPLLLLLANRDWFFTPDGFFDPWRYVGFFYQYIDPDYRPNDYKLARLPWVLCGFLVTKLFTPVTAAVVLHAVFLCVTPLGLFIVVQLLLGRPVLAAVTALCLGFYTQGHGSGGWDYHNTSSGAFYLATVALSILPSATQGHRLLLLAVGVMAAITVHNNITFANLLPSLAYLYLHVVYLRTGTLPSARTIVVRTAWVGAGVLVATVLLGLVNVMVGRHFLFFSDLVDLVKLYLTNSKFQAGRPLSTGGWVLEARHLAVPTAVFVAGVATVLVNRRRIVDQNGRMAAALVMQFLPVLPLWAAWQSAGHTALDWDYMAYALIPTTFLALGGLLHRGWPAWCERHGVVVLLGSALVLTACLSVEQVPGAQRLTAWMAPFMFIGGCLILVVPLLAYLWRPSVLSSMCIVALFAFDNRLLGGNPEYFATDRCKIQPSVYSAIVDAASWMMAIDPFYNSATVWFDENERIRPLEGCSVSLAYMTYSLNAMAAGKYLTGFPLPGIDRVPDETLRALTNDAILVILTNTPAHLDGWSRRLDAMGLSHSEIESHRVPLMESGFTLHAWRIGSPSQ